MTSAIRTTSGSVHASAMPPIAHSDMPASIRATTPSAITARMLLTASLPISTVAIRRRGRSSSLMIWPSTIDSERASCSRSTRRSENSATSEPEQNAEIITHTAASGIASESSVITRGPRAPGTSR